VRVIIRAGYVGHYGDYGMGWKTAELGFSSLQEHGLMCSVLCSLQTSCEASDCVHQVTESVKCQPAICTKC
jgi:hypothetical protein